MENEEKVLTLKSLEKETNIKFSEIHKKIEMLEKQIEILKKVRR